LRDCGELVLKNCLMLMTHKKMVFSTEVLISRTMIITTNKEGVLIMFYMWINWMRLSIGMDAVIGGPVVQGCDGCVKATSLLCNVYEKPAAHWNRGGCFFNFKPEVKATPKKRVGQQKQKKGA